MDCPTCGASNPEGALYCSTCGAGLVSSAPDGTPAAPPEGSTSTPLSGDQTPTTPPARGTTWSQPPLEDEGKTPPGAGGGPTPVQPTPSGGPTPVPPAPVPQPPPADYGQTGQYGAGGPPPPPGQYGAGPQQPPGYGPGGQSGQGYGPPQAPYGPFGGPGYGSPYGGPRPNIPNYLVWSILTTLFCCLPAGVVSIVYAAQVSGKIDEGDYATARRYSSNARTWAIVSAGLAVGSWILFMLFFFVAGISNGAGY